MHWYHLWATRTPCAQRQQCRQYPVQTIFSAGLQFLHSLRAHGYHHCPWLTRSQAFGSTRGCIAEIVAGNSLLPTMRYLEKHQNTKHLHELLLFITSRGLQNALAQSAREGGTSNNLSLSALTPLWHLQPKLSPPSFLEQDCRWDKTDVFLNTP